MKGHNTCAWTEVGKTTLCGKCCCRTHFKIDLAKTRKSTQIHMCCRSCSEGVQSDIRLCRVCGREQISHRNTLCITYTMVIVIAWAVIDITNITDISPVLYGFTYLQDIIIAGGNTLLKVGRMYGLITLTVGAGMEVLLNDGLQTLLGLNDGLRD